MDLNTEYANLVNTLKINSNAAGKKITNEAIAERLEISRTYLSSLISGKQEVTMKHIQLFKQVFKDELAGIIAAPPSPKTEDEATQAAILKMLYSEVAKLKAATSGRSLEQCLAEMKADTILNLQDILR